ncbi:MAG: signal peptidase II [Anaerolineaceae bacterium]
MKHTFKDYAILFGMAGVIIGLDQWTKALVRNDLAVGEIWSPWDWLTPYARIIHWQNSGAAFGIFQQAGGVFAILAILIAAMIIFYFPRIPSGEWPLRMAMGLQLGGALGNLIDRLTQGGRVTDFISVGNFAVFNVADASITVGVIVLLLGVWWMDRKEKKEHELEARLNDSTAVDDSTSEENRG